MNGCLIEGMGCPGGCIAGAGTNIPLPKAKKDLAAFVKNSSKSIPPKELEEIELIKINTNLTAGLQEKKAKMP